MKIIFSRRHGLLIVDAPLPMQAVAVALRAAPAWIVGASLLLMASSAWAGEADRGHDFRDIREAIIRQLSPEGRYCRECHQRKPAFKAENVRPLPPVPLPATALLFGSALGGVVIATRKWRRT